VFGSIFNRRLAEWEPSWRHVAPIIELVFPMRTRRQSRFSKRDAVQSSVPVGGIGDEAHRNIAADVYCRPERADPVLRNRWNCKLQSDQRSRCQRMIEADLLHLAPLPF